MHCSRPECKRLQDYDDVFKVVVLGEPAVGKSCLVSKLLGKSRKQYVPTREVEFATHKRSINNRVAKAQIWDFSGKFWPISPKLLKDTTLTLLVYDITARRSFENLHIWLEAVQQSRNAAGAVYLVGNKADLETDRQVHCSSW